MNNLKLILQQKVEKLLQLQDGISLFIEFLNDEEKNHLITNQSLKNNQTIAEIDKLNLQINEQLISLNDETKLVEDILVLKVNKVPPQFEELLDLSEKIKSTLEEISDLNKKAIDLTEKSLKETAKLLKKNKNEQKLNDRYSPVNNLHSGLFLDIKN